MPTHPWAEDRGDIHLVAVRETRSCYQTSLWAAVSIGGWLLRPPRIVEAQKRRESDVPDELREILAESLGPAVASLLEATGRLRVLLATSQPVPWSNAFGSGVVNVLDRVRCETAVLPALCGGRVVEWEPDHDRLLYVGGTYSSIDVVTLVTTGKAEELAARRTARSHSAWKNPADLVATLFEQRRDQLGGKVHLLRGREVGRNALTIGFETLSHRLGPGALAGEPVLLPVAAVMRGALLASGVVRSLP